MGKVIGSILERIELYNKKKAIISCIEEKDKMFYVAHGKSAKTIGYNYKRDIIIKMNVSNQEIVLLRKCTESMIAKNNINFIFMYEECYNKNNYILIEPADGYLMQLLYHFEDVKKLESIILQCIMAILSLHNLGYYHNNANYKNFLFIEIKDCILEYKINSNSFKIRSYGFLILLIDFKYATNKEYLKERDRILTSRKFGYSINIIKSINNDFFDYFTFIQSLFIYDNLHSQLNKFKTIDIIQEIHKLKTEKDIINLLINKYNNFEKIKKYNENPIYITN